MPHAELAPERPGEEHPIRRSPRRRAPAITEPGDPDHLHASRRIALICVGVCTGAADHRYLVSPAQISRQIGEKLSGGRRVGPEELIDKQDSHDAATLASLPE